MGLTPATALREVLLSARSFAEYVAMFDVRPADLEGSILDCPGGAGSFASEVRSRGGRIVSVDPAYRLPPALLSGVVHADAERANRYVADHRDEYSWRFFTSLSHHDSVRVEAADRFLNDRVARVGAYVAGALPALPFADLSFDLVLSGHLLFTYADRLDREFHVASIRELVRVSRLEVRIFPLVDGVMRRYTGLEDVRRELDASGVITERRRVDYDFQPGSAEMLVCRRRRPCERPG